MYCPNCGVTNPPGSIFCNVCGKELPPLSTSVTCPYCGADGQEYQFNCTKCGRDLPRDRKINPLEPPARASTSTGAASGETPSAQPPPPAVNACPICGRPKGIYADKCSYCSQPDAYSSSQDYSGSDYSNESDLPKIAGILIIIAGILGVFYGLLTLGAITSYGLPGPATCCAGLMLLFGFVAIAGGFSAMGRGSGVFSIVGAVFGILAIGFGIGALLSLIGLILVAMSWDEYQN